MTPTRARHAAVLALLVAGAASACGDGPAEPPEGLRFTARLDGEAWSAESYASRWGTDTVYVGGFRAGSPSAAELSVSLRIARLAGPGRYPMGPGDARVSETVGGDVLVAEYVSGGDAGEVVVTGYDAARAEVTGTAAFEAARTYAHNGTGPYGDRVRVTAGAFRARVVVPGTHARAGRAAGPATR